MNLPVDAHVYDLTTSGYFDAHISQFADRLKEFDNPFYPWYRSGDDAASSFKQTWIHTSEIFKARHAHNVIWIWNP